MLALGLALPIVLAGTASEAAELRTFDIPAQSLSRTLLEISRQGNIDVLAPQALTHGRGAPRIKGRMTAREALARALRGSGLAFRQTSSGTFVIETRAAPATLQRPAPPRPARTRPFAPPQRPPHTIALEDIIVTAQRRTENGKDVPIAVRSWSGIDLASGGVGTVADLQQIDSSLTVSSQSGVIIPFLRGIGNPASSTPGNESSVPVYVDEIYLGRLYPVYLSLADIDRLEVLKGPQGTLFGRNATGGLVQIFTRSPGEEPEAGIELGYSNFQTLRGKVYAATPLGSTAAINLSVSAQHMGGGWGHNLTTGDDTYFTNYLNVRTKLVTDLSDRTQLRLSAYRAYQHSSQGEVQGAVLRGSLRGQPPLFETPFDAPSGFYDLKTDHPSFHRHHGYGGSLKIAHDLGFADLINITAYRHARETWHSEGDLTDAPYLSYNLRPRDTTISQELQLKSKPDATTPWIVGAYYLDFFAAIDPTSVFGDAISATGIDRLDLVGWQKLHSYALFGQTSLPLPGKSGHLTLGLRYTIDEVHGYGETRVIDAGQSHARLTSSYRDSRTFDKLTFKAAVDRRLSDDVMAYASVSRGYKSGGFNTLPLDSPPLLPETVDAYEAGIKIQSARRNARLNLAIFRNDIRNPQVQIVRNMDGVAVNQFANAERARTQGVEFDASARLAKGLQIDMSGQFLDARFMRFTDAPINTPLLVPPYGVITTSGDVSGNRTVQAPKFKATLRARYDFATDDARIRLDASVAYRSSFKWEPDNRVTEPALTLVNASVTYEPDDVPGLSVRLWSNNLTNRKYLSNELTQSGPVGYMASPAEPRTFGIDFRYRLQ